MSTPLSRTHVPLPAGLSAEGRSEIGAEKRTLTAVGGPHTMGMRCAKWMTGVLAALAASADLNNLAYVVALETISVLLLIWLLLLATDL